MQAESRDPAEIQAKGIGRVWEKSIAVLVATWVRTGRRWRMVFLCCGIAAAVIMYSNLHRVPVPRIRLEYSDEQSSQSTAPALSPTAPSSFQPQNSPLNVSKVALLIEDRPLPVLAPLLLHFISVVPPDWRFRFMGSAESVASVNGSHAVRAQVASGKLDLARIPANASTGGQELISRFLTSRWLYETALRPAEWLLVFQTDSILCANSRQNLNDFLDYDWVGAPWNPSGRFGGNGGLSLRRVSAISELVSITHLYNLPPAPSSPSGEKPREKALYRKKPVFPFIVRQLCKETEQKTNSNPLPLQSKSSATRCAQTAPSPKTSGSRSVSGTGPARAWPTGRSR